MEKSNSIPESDFIKGVYIELECCMCGEQKTIAARNPKELSNTLDEEGWKEIDSDKFALIGHHCGCDYR